MPLKRRNQNKPKQNCVKREFLLPTLDQLLATTFSNLDWSSSFHKILLHEKSLELTNFITLNGRYCVKRLPCRISFGSQSFHRDMTYSFFWIREVIWDIEDVFISGRNQKEHEQRLWAILQRIKTVGVTLNDKHVFSVGIIKFLGHFIS